MYYGIAETIWKKTFGLTKMFLHVSCEFSASPYVHDHEIPSSSVSNRPPTVWFCPLSADNVKRCCRGEKSVNKMAEETASITTACYTAHSDYLQC